MGRFAQTCCRTTDLSAYVSCTICVAVTNAAGVASCSIAGVNQSTSTAGITVSFGGDSYYQS